MRKSSSEGLWQTVTDDGCEPVIEQILRLCLSVRLIILNEVLGWLFDIVITVACSNQGRNRINLT